MKLRIRWVPVGAKQWSVVDQFRAQLNGCSIPEWAKVRGQYDTYLSAHDWGWDGESGPAPDFRTMTCRRCGMQIEQVEDETT